MTEPTAKTAIPDEAWTAVGRSVAESYSHWDHRPNRGAYVGQALNATAVAAVEVAAPHLVAAELRRLADEFFYDGHQQVAREMRARADELTA